MDANVFQSIDEQIIQFKDKLLKQFKPKSSKLWKVKVFVRDWSSGYAYRFKVYQGSANRGHGSDLKAFIGPRHLRHWAH